VLPDFFSARPDGAPCLTWPGGEIRRYRGRLYAGRPLPARTRAVARAEASTFDLGPALGSLRLVEAIEGGLRSPLPAEPELRFRVGGESIKPHPGRPRKRLKDLCQEAGVVPWMRDRLPLLYVGDRLAAVGDLWIDEAFEAAPGVPALKPVWSGRPRLY
jgi:tRNA(Ile)-lysidine synthase